MPKPTPCIITVAITGSLPKKANNPAVPITIAEQVESTQEAFEAGATLAHLHVRNDDQTSSSDPARFARLKEELERHCPGMILQFSTGGRSGAGKERGGMLPLKPDMASLATGSCNFPTRVYENAPDLIDWLAAEMLAYGIKPEIEAFDLSMIFKAIEMERAGQIKGPLHVQFVMGVKNAMPVDREVLEFYVTTLKRLAPDATWTGAGIGKDQLTLNRWSLELGGHCRTGLEDNVRMDRDELAASNAALVRRVAEPLRRIRPPSGLGGRGALATEAASGRLRCADERRPDLRAAAGRRRGRGDLGGRGPCARHGLGRDRLGQGGRSARGHRRRGSGRDRGLTRRVRAGPRGLDPRHRRRRRAGARPGGAAAAAGRRRRGGLRPLGRHLAGHPRHRPGAAAARGAGAARAAARRR